MILPPSKHLPSRINKLLTRSTGSIGIRVPEDPLTKEIVHLLDGPIVVSSANLENKPGSGSAATVRTRFSRTVEVWVDAMDIPPEPPSTLVELTEQAFKIIRDGAVSHDAIARALA